MHASFLPETDDRATGPVSKADPVLALADRLASSRKTFLSDQSLAAFGKRVGLDFDDARRAAIVADRLRRQRQAAEGRAGFKAAPLPIAAPIALRDRKDPRRGER